MPVYLAPSGSSEQTVDTLVDRVYRDYLEPADDQPVMVATAAEITTADTTVTYDDATFAPDEEDLLAPGVLIELGYEQMRVTDVDPDTNTISVLRAVNGTEAAAFDAGTEIRVAPIYARQSVFEAVADNIVALYPDLHATATPGDYLEMETLRSVLPETVLVTARKGTFGHGMGAGAAATRGVVSTATNEVNADRRLYRRPRPMA